MSVRATSTLHHYIDSDSRKRKVDDIDPVVNDGPEENMQEGNVQNVRSLNERGIRSMQIVNNWLFGKTERSIKMWSLVEGVCLKTFQEEKPISHYTATETALFTVTTKGKIKKWDLEDDTTVELQEDNLKVTCLKYHQGSLFLGYDGIIAQFDPDLKLIRQFDKHKDTLNTMRFTHGHLYSGSNDKTVIKWSLKDGKEIKVIDTKSRVGTLEISGAKLFTAGNDNVKMWDRNSGQLLHTFRLLGSSIHFEVEGNYLTASIGASSGTNTVALRQWNIRTKEVVGEINAYNWPSQTGEVVSQNRFVHSFVSSGNTVYMVHRGAPHLTIADLDTDETQSALVNGYIIPQDSVRNQFHNVFGSNGTCSPEVVKGDGYVCLSDGKNITILGFHDTGRDPSLAMAWEAVSEVSLLTFSGITKTLGSIGSIIGNGPRTGDAGPVGLGGFGMGGVGGVGFGK